LVHGAKKKMKMLRNRKALSTVITTLIILIVSVLLATVVTFYAINVTTIRVCAGKQA
jgi:competence protein ComGC